MSTAWARDLVYWHVTGTYHLRRHDGMFTIMMVFMI